jgi:hypothetical protein
MSNAEARTACRSFGPQFDLVVFDSQEQQAELEASAPFRELVRGGMAYYHLGLYIREQQPACPPAAKQPRWVNSTWLTDPSYCWVNDTSEAAGSYSTSFWRVDGKGPTAPFPFPGNETYIYTHWSERRAVHAPAAAQARPGCCPALQPPAAAASAGCRREGAERTPACPPLPSLQRPPARCSGATSPTAAATAPWPTGAWASSPSCELPRRPACCLPGPSLLSPAANAGPQQAVRPQCLRLRMCATARH